ncbi:MAG TPA: methyltransferase domain-containing protein [Terriglobia bacterium]|nr:methyltransferase domain-containing protein [Terriglobia bacterium]
MPSANDLLSRLQRLADQLLPASLLARLDPVAGVIAAEVARFARGLPLNAVVLDAGAGEARFRSRFERQRYVALDNGVGDSTWDYSHLDVVGDLLNLPIGEASCDALLSVVVLEHTPDPYRVVAEMGRVLGTGGRMLLVVPLIWELHQTPHDYFRFTRYGLERMLGTAGLEISRLEPLGGFFWLAGRYSFYFLKFWRNGLRAVFLPVLAPFFGFLIPLICYYLDPLDRTGQYTLGYVCEAWKPR